METPRTPGQRAGLTRETVLTAAQRLLAERGLGALSMRSLARRLGVAPNALYSHVANKTDLIDNLLDETLAAVEAPDPQHTDPRAGLASIMTSTYTVLIDQADLVPLFLARQGARGPYARRLGEIMLDLLARAGVKEAAANEALRVLIVYTIGFAALTTQPPVENGSNRPLSSDELSGNFAAGLQWLLDGILNTAADVQSRT